VSAAADTWAIGKRPVDEPGGIGARICGRPRQVWPDGPLELPHAGLAGGPRRGPVRLRSRPRA